MQLLYKSTEATFPCLPVELFSYISWGFGNQTTFGLYNHMNKTVKEIRLSQQEQSRKELLAFQMQRSY